MSDIEYFERLTLCAQLDQVVPIDKDRCFAHYEGPLAEFGQGSEPDVRA